MKKNRITKKQVIAYLKRYKNKLNVMDQSYIENCILTLKEGK